MYICEFEFEQAGDFILCWPFFPGRVDCTQGKDFDDAIEMAADWLKTIVLDYLMNGEEVPNLPRGNEPKHGGGIITVAVDASLAEIPAVTAQEAAGLLGVSSARINQLVKAGYLDSWKVGRTRMVSIESIQARLADERKAGRPKRELAATT
jgi:excisionase family DNA binding protein